MPEPSSEPDPQPTPVAPPATVKDVAVTIVTIGEIGGAVEVSGIVPEVVEGDGTCTLTLESQGVVLDASATATPGTESTYCGLLRVDDARLTAGTWAVRLSYDSPSSRGVSDVTNLDVRR